MRRKAGVLSLFSDSQGKLIIRDNDKCLLLIRIRKNRDNLCRRKRIFNQICLVLIPVDDVDLLTIQFIHNRVDTGTVHADTGSDCIDIRLIAVNCDLRTRSGLSCNCLDLDHTITDFRDFFLEESLHQLRMCAGYKDFRPPRGIPDLQHVYLDSFRRLELLTLYHFLGLQNRVYLAEIYADIPSDISLNNTRNNLMFLLIVLVVQGFSLFLTDLLEYDVLRIHGRNPSEALGLDLNIHRITNLRTGIDLERLLLSDLCDRILHMLYHRLGRKNVIITGLRIYRDRYIIRTVILILVGLQKRLLNCLQKSVLADPLFLFKSIQSFQ